MLVERLKAQKHALIKESEQVLAEAGDNPLTEDQSAKMAELKTKLTAVSEKLDAALALREEDLKSQAISVHTAQPTNQEVTVHAGSRISAGEDKSKLHASFGDFLLDVAEAARGVVSDKLQYHASASGMNSAVGSEGGWLVRKDFRTDLITAAQQQSMLLPLCTRIPIGEGADGLEMPYIDETSRVDGSRLGGVRVYRINEADTVTATKPKIGRHEVRLEDLMALCYCTDRNLRDTVSLGSFIQQSFASEFGFVIDDEILTGTGSGQMLGVLNSGALVTVSKESSQTAATIVQANISKMWARMPVRYRRNAVWVINPDVESALDGLTIGNFPAYMPAGGLSATPYGQIKGRPVLPMEQAKTLGTVGDILLIDPSQYLVIEKGGLQAEESMHVRFIYGERTFRFTYAINGQPMLRSAITPKNGSNTMSAFIALQTRS